APPDVGHDETDEEGRPRRPRGSSPRFRRWRWRDAATPAGHVPRRPAMSLAAALVRVASPRVSRGDAETRRLPYFVSDGVAPAGENEPARYARQKQISHSLINRRRRRLSATPRLCVNKSQLQRTVQKKEHYQCS